VLAKFRTTGISLSEAAARAGSATTGLSLFRLVSLRSALTRDAVQFLALGTRSKVASRAKNLFLRKHLALYREREIKPRRATDATRLSMVLLSRPFAWQNALVEVKPETFLR